MCFSVLWLVQTLVWLIVVCGIVAILMIVVPWVLSWLGVGLSSMVMQVIRIIVAVIVLVALVWFLYDLYVCAVGGAARVR